MVIHLPDADLRGDEGFTVFCPASEHEIPDHMLRLHLLGYNLEYFLIAA